MSLIPYRSTPRNPVRKSLDRDRIVQVAMELLERSGFEGLTMRAIGEALDVKAASLYRHVKDKQELLVLLADEISAEIPLPPEGGSWQDRARALANATRTTLLARRDAARVLAETPPMGPRRLQRVEAALGIFLDAGFSGREAVAAGYNFNNFVTELVNDEARLTQAARATGLSRQDLMAGMGQTFRDLPPGSFPVLNALADDLAKDDFEDLFLFGREAWLVGLERILERGGGSGRTNPSPAL